MNPDPRENPATELKPPGDFKVGGKRFDDFDIEGHVFIITGASRGLGLSMAEAVGEAGGKGNVDFFNPLLFPSFYVA